MRLFAAIGLSPAAEDALVYAQDILRWAGRGSFPRREMLHLTLAFLGETADAAAAEAAVEALRGAGPISLTVEGVGQFGDTWWAGVGENPGLERLALGHQADLRRRGFVAADRADPWFELLWLPLAPGAEPPRFRPSVRGPGPAAPGFTLYYSHQCPYTAKYVPVVRAVAEAAGFQVSWDKEYGAVVKTDSGETVFFIRPDQKQAHGPAVSGQPSLSGPCLIADGVSYLELHDLARLLGLYYGG